MLTTRLDILHTDGRYEVVDAGPDAQATYYAMTKTLVVTGPFVSITCDRVKSYYLGLTEGQPTYGREARDT